MPSKMPLKSVSSLSTNVIMAGVGYTRQPASRYVYFAEILLGEGSLVVSVDLNNLGKCHQEFCHLYL